MLLLVEKSINRQSTGRANMTFIVHPVLAVAELALANSLAALLISYRQAINELGIFSVFKPHRCWRAISRTNTREREKRSRKTVAGGKAGRGRVSLAEVASL